MDDAESGNENKDKDKGQTDWFVPSSLAWIQLAASRPEEYDIREYGPQIEGRDPETYTTLSIRDFTGSYEGLMKMAYVCSSHCHSANTQSARMFGDALLTRFQTVLGLRLADFGMSARCQCAG